MLVRTWAICFHLCRSFHTETGEIACCVKEVCVVRGLLVRAIGGSVAEWRDRAGGRCHWHDRRRRVADIMFIQTILGNGLCHWDKSFSILLKCHDFRGIHWDDAVTFLAEDRDWCYSKKVKLSVGGMNGDLE